MFDLAIFDLPCAAIKTFFAQWQSKGLITVINPVPEDSYCMLARVCIVLDYTNKKHVIIYVILPFESLWTPPCL
jgi:hypothetical protein